MLKMLVYELFGKMRFSFFSPFSFFDLPTFDKSVETDLYSNPEIILPRGRQN